MPDEKNSARINLIAATARANAFSSSLLNALIDYNMALEEKRPSHLEKLRSLAQERQDYLREILRRFPAAVLAGSLGDKQREGLPTVLEPLLETDVSLTGSLEHYHHDYFSVNTIPSLQRIEHLYYLQPEQGERIRIYFPDEGPKCDLQGDFKIQGPAVEGNVVVRSYSSSKIGRWTYRVGPDLSVEKIQTAPATERISSKMRRSQTVGGSTDVLRASGTSTIVTPQQHKIAVILYNFVDFDSQPITQTDARNMTFTATGNTFQTGSVNCFFRESTYGKIQFTGDLRADGDVFGWYTLNHTSYHTDGSRWIYDDAFVPLIQDQARADGFNIENYEVVVYVSNFDDQSGVWHGNKIIFSSGGHRSYWPLFAHELGHALGLGHAHSLHCVNPGGQSVPISDDSTYTEYGDFFDIMAFAAGFGHHNAWEKLTLGVLNSSNVLIVTASGTYTLNSLESPAGGVQILRIPVGDLHFSNGNDMYYYVEFRANTGWDAGFIVPDWGGGSLQTYPVPDSGVLIKFAPDPGISWGPFAVQANIPSVNPAPPDNIAYYPLPVGRTFLDPAARITITTVSSTANSATIAIGIPRSEVPAAVSWGANRLDVFAVGSDGMIYHDSWNGSIWEAQWDSGGGPSNEQFSSPPTAVSWGANRLDIFAVGGDGMMYHDSWNGSAWEARWDSRGGPPNGRFSSSPAAVSWGANQLDVFAVGSDGMMYQNSWNGSAWEAQWDSRGGPPNGRFSSSPAAVSWGANRLDVFAVGSDGMMYHNSWNGSVWEAQWDSRGGPPNGLFSRPPAAVSRGANRLDVFAVGSDGMMYHNSWNGSAWEAQWDSRGGPPNGQFSSSPAAVSWGANRLDVFAVGSDGMMYHNSWNGSAWEAQWDSRGGPPNGQFSSSPAAVSWGANRLDVFAVGSDGMMYHNSWNGSVWEAQWDSRGGRFR